MTSGTGKKRDVLLRTGDQVPEWFESAYLRLPATKRRLLILLALLPQVAGCHLFAPGNSVLQGLVGQGGGGSSSPSEVVLVDRTGQPLPGDNRVSETLNHTDSFPLLDDNAGAPAAPQINLRPTEGAEPDAAREPTQPIPATGRTWDEFSAGESVGTTSAVQSRPRESAPGEFFPRESTPIPSRESSRVASQSPVGAGSVGPSQQGQSFRVQLIDDEPRESEYPQEYYPGNINDPSQAMFNTIQQVTQQGLGRMMGGSNNSTASPALANLLLENMQQEVSNQRLQQASLSLDTLESAAEIPSFDLRGHQSVPQPGQQGHAANPLGLRAPTETGVAPFPSNDQSQSEVLPVGSWRQNVNTAIQSVEQAIAQSTEVPERQSLEIYLRLLRLIVNERDEAVRSIDSLPPSRQAFWREQIFALSQIIQAPEAEQEAMYVNHSRQATKALASLQNAVQALRDEATLQLRQVQFCQEIRSFGDFERARSTVAAPGDPMLVYCEVVNYAVQRRSDTAGEFYQANLVPSYMIFDERQQQVSQKVYSVVHDTCRSRRQDFYLVLQLEVPNLPSGKYHLQVSVEDIEAGKIAVSAPLAFQVRAVRD